MDVSPLARLPSELRNNIYEFVFYQRRTVIVNIRDGHAQWQPPLRETQPLALAGTCKQLRSESLPVFYGINTFEIFPGIAQRHCCNMTTEADLSFIDHWTSALGPAAKHIQDVIVEIGTLWDMGCRCFPVERVANICSRLAQSFNGARTAVVFTAEIPRFYFESPGTYVNFRISFDDLIGARTVAMRDMEEMKKVCESKRSGPSWAKAKADLAQLFDMLQNSSLDHLTEARQTCEKTGPRIVQ